MLRWREMVLVVAIIAVVSGTSIYFGYSMKSADIPANVPVCHAVTEDSDITDCSYHDGTWWTK